MINGGGTRGVGVSPRCSSQARLATSSVPSAARLMLATPSISSPATQIGMISNAGKYDVTPLWIAPAVVASVQTAITIRAEIVGRPSRTRMISALKNTTSTTIGINGLYGVLLPRSGGTN